MFVRALRITIFVVAMSSTSHVFAGFLIHQQAENNFGPNVLSVSSEASRPALPARTHRTEQARSPVERDQQARHATRSGPAPVSNGGATVEVSSNSSTLAMTDAGPAVSATAQLAAYWLCEIRMTMEVTFLDGVFRPPRLDVGQLIAT